MDDETTPQTEQDSAKQVQVLVLGNHLLENCVPSG